MAGTLYETCVDRVSVAHDIDNVSDHHPIFTCLSLDTKYVGVTGKVHSPRPSWVKACIKDLDQYRDVLSKNLAHLILIPQIEALTCRDMQCSSVNHAAALTRYVSELTKCCVDACQRTIPVTKCRQSSGRIAGWNELVKPYRDKSLFWHQVWIDNGRPRSGTVAECMRRTRAMYHYAVRNAKNNEERLISERLAECLLSNNNRDFWREIKKIRYNKCGRSKVADGVSSDVGIANVFVRSYKDLFTGVPYDKMHMQRLVHENSESVVSTGFVDDCVVITGEVRNAVLKLKASKADGCFELSTDHFVHAGDDLFVHIALLFSAMVVHGCCPQQLTTSTVIPIQKSCNVNLADSNNYRGIALSPIFVKIFDHIVLMRYHSMLITSELQFGFKAKCSTNMCTLILKETMSYYVNNDSSVFCTFLDATKAFDRIRYCKLFRKLLDRGIPPCIIRVLLGFYLNNMIRIAWNGILSDYFWQSMVSSRVVF